MKKLIFISIIFLSNYAIGQNLNDNLLIHYPLDSNSALDVSGNNFHGLGNTSPTEDRFGNPNGAVHFNGINQFIEFPNNDSLKPNLPITLAFWVKLETFDPVKNIFVSTDYSNDGHSGVWVNLTSLKQMSLSYGDTENYSSNDRRTGSHNAIIRLDEWYYVVTVVTGAYDMNIFVNNVETPIDYSAYGGPLNYTDNPGSLGKRGTEFPTESYFFQGSIDDFKYWDRALSIEDISKLYEQYSSTDTTKITVYDTTYIAVTDTLFIDVKTSSVPTNIANEIKIYPNPASEFIYIDNSGFSNLTNYKIQIINSIGQVVWNDVLSQEQYIIAIDDIGDAGTYFINIFDENNEIVNTKTLIFR